ncbi:hypothetical protein PN36_34600 [Candidatus Thiomargarita nelsonii]|uniref:Uncharacterized protein n=1 Tax=Candidatus Thiomargarita nelsonii TaxID=1003181 RepID=A0A0A6P2Z0_9GAMM|nr:hypothetical protein PN36_34600 [Candidatus Thiomargarita nelsonii]
MDYQTTYIMPNLNLNLKPTHKIIKAYYQEIAKLSDKKITTEGSVAPSFANILRHCAAQTNLNFIEQYPLNRESKQPIRTDGTRIEQF